VLYVALQSNGAFKLVGSRAKKISPHLFVRIRMSKLLHCLDDVRDALHAIVSFDRLENFITMRGVAGAGIAESVRWFHWIDAAGAYCDSTHKAVF
jgi:hypothetical protein